MSISLIFHSQSCILRVFCSSFLKFYYSLFSPSFSQAHCTVLVFCNSLCASFFYSCQCYTLPSVYHFPPCLKGGKGWCRNGGKREENKKGNEGQGEGKRRNERERFKFSISTPISSCITLFLNLTSPLIP